MLTKTLRSRTSKIHAHNDTVLEFGSIDRLESTLSVGGTSHCVNNVAVQHKVCGPHLEVVLLKVDKSKRRSCSVTETPLPIYDVSQRRGPLRGT